MTRGPDITFGSGATYSLPLDSWLARCEDKADHDGQKANRWYFLDITKGRIYEFKKAAEEASGHTNHLHVALAGRGVLTYEEPS